MKVNYIDLEILDEKLQKWPIFPLLLKEATFVLFLVLIFKSLCWSAQLNQQRVKV